MLTRRRIFVGFVALAVGVALTLLAAFIGFRMGYIETWLTARVQNKLSEYGARFEIGSLKTNLSDLTIEAKDLQFFVDGSTQPFATIKSVTAAVALRDVLGWSGPTEIRLKSSLIEGLRARYEVDESGRSNLDGLHPSAVPQRRYSFLYTSATTTLRDAEFLYLDRVHKLDGVGRDISLTLSPAGGEEMLLAATSRQSEFVYDGRSAKGLDIDLRALVTGTAARIESLELRSAYANAMLKGDIKNWLTFEYNLEAHADLRLRDFGELLAPDLRLAGAARFDGRVEGSGIDYRATGRLQSEKLSARDVRLDGLSLTASGAGTGKDATARTEAAVALLEAAGFRVNRFSGAGDLVLNASAFDWTGQFRAASFANDTLTGSDVLIERAKLRGPLADLSQSSLNGQIRIGSLVTADVSIGSLTGDVLATADFIELPRFTGAFFEGQASGRLRLAMNGRGQSDVVADLSGVNADRTIAAALGRRLPVRGRASGRIDLRWPGTDHRASQGTIKINFAGDTASSANQVNALPLTGTLSLNASGGRFRLADSVIATGKSELRASGDVDWDGRGTLSVALISTDARELTTLLEDFVNASGRRPTTEGIDELLGYLHEYEIELDHGIQFRGTIAGKLTEPAITGQFQIDSITVDSQVLGKLTGNIDYSADALRLRDTVLVQPNGGQADFSFDYAFNVDNDASWRGRLRDVVVGPLARFVTDMKVDGRVSGTAELSGIPEAMRGSGELTVLAAKYEDYEAPEVNGTFTLDGTKVETREASIKFAGGVVTGNGWFDTRTNGYLINLSGQGLEVAEVVNRPQGQKLDVSGKFDIKLEAASSEFQRAEKGGHIFDRLSASVSSRELQYAGRALGDVVITSKGANSIAEVEVAANLVGHRYTGAGRVDFATREAPVLGKIDLRDVSLGPIAELLSDGQVSAPGNIVGEVRFGGSLFGESDPFRVEVELTTLAIESGDLRLAALPPVLLKLQGEELDIGRIRFSGTSTNLEVAGKVAVGEKGQMAISANGDLNLRLLQNFVQEITSDGIVKVQISATGGLRQPRLTGSATVENASLRSREFPLSLTKGNGRLLFTSDQAQIANFTGEVGGGTVSLTGGAALDGLALDRWRVQSRLNNVRVDYPQDFRTTADGEVTLQGSRRVQVLSGLVNVRRGEFLAEADLFELIERFMTEFTGGVGGSGVVSGVPQTQLDLRLVANDTLVINNKALDLVASADLRVMGSLDDPLFKGRLTISRGLIDDFFRERYRITSGLIEFPGISQRSPRVGIDLETVISGYRLNVLIAGTFDNLRVTPRSEPPLPQADVVALITSGALPREGLTADSPTQSLARTQPANLSTILAQPLSSRIEANVTGRLFGLNRFSIDPTIAAPGTDPSARVTVGRRITRDFSITYSTNLASNQDQVVLIEYRASDRLSFVASRAQDGAFGIDVRLRKRF